MSNLSWSASSKAAALRLINSIVRLYTVFYLYNRSQTRNSTIELGHVVAIKKYDPTISKY